MEYGLIGEKLGHSYSKEIHEQLADYTYDLHPVSREDFPNFMEQRDFKAINVTIPYKQDVIPYLDEIDEHAREIGAVNTIVHKNGKLYGHNTDFSGLLYMMKKNNIPVEDKKCLVLGNGGAAKAVIAVLKAMHASQILVVSRQKKQVSSNSLSPQKNPDTITYQEAATIHSNAQLIVNTTPVGMYPDNDSSPIDLTPFGECQAVVDIIYNPLETKLTAQAKEFGMIAITGLEMLVAQALYAAEFFLDTRLDSQQIDSIYQRLVAEKQNVKK